MILELETRPRDDVEGGLEFVIRGDHDAGFWLMNAAGNFRDGFTGNGADATDGTGNRLALEPLRPNGVKGTKAHGTRLDHREPQSRPAPPAPSVADQQPAGLEIPRELVDREPDRALELIRQRLEVEEPGDLVIRVRARVESPAGRIDRGPEESASVTPGPEPQAPPAPAGDQWTPRDERDAGPPPQQEA